MLDLKSGLTLAGVLHHVESSRRSASIGTEFKILFLLSAWLLFVSKILRNSKIREKLVQVISLGNTLHFIPCEVEVELLTLRTAEDVGGYLGFNCLVWSL